MEQERIPSPCLTCTRVKNPRDCENKNCREWQGWFLARWEKIRKMSRLQMEKQKPLEGVNIGGHTYIHPDRLRDYLQKDPCKDCLCPRELCTVPCPARRTWEETREEVFL